MIIIDDYKCVGKCDDAAWVSWSSETCFAEFDYLEAADGTAVDGEPDESAHLLPSVVACGSGIDVKQSQHRVGHDLEDVGMATHHQPYPVFGEQTFDSGCIFPRIASDVGQKYVHALHLEYLGLAAAAAHVAVVDVASHGAHHWRHRLETADYVDVADITGVPDLIAVLEMGRVAVVPAGMGVGKYAYCFHFRRRLIRLSSMVPCMYVRAILLGPALSLTRAVVEGKTLIQSSGRRGGKTSVAA